MNSFEFENSVRQLSNTIDLMKNQFTEVMKSIDKEHKMYEVIAALIGFNPKVEYPMEIHIHSEDGHYETMHDLILITIEQKKKIRKMKKIIQYRKEHIITERDAKQLIDKELFKYNTQSEMKSIQKAMNEIDKYTQFINEVDWADTSDKTPILIQEKLLNCAKIDKILNDLTKSIIIDKKRTSNHSDDKLHLLNKELKRVLNSSNDSKTIDFIQINQVIDYIEAEMQGKQLDYNIELNFSNKS
ncbi:hypothetical protein TRFO_39330 [Tritrichomonas foetus]|uniref:Uncharacterized protein n=1 Tax=Tritrichomonas foetus TaxID=1144522 RepID=A0A1J4J5K0_9EUKA|nr:hypothetical protein TRFO_39330 [Tritrichomonas foetus]|eukprot:OHS94514.1 hypothetical protein TRFO_39330 [Tritrichomonas foetus]